ncbi:MAG: UbiA prenyltransferase family protein [Thermoplasmatota archaeon]
MRETVAAWVKLLRLPGLGGLAIPPVFGALTVGVTDAWSLLILFLIGCMVAIYGFVLNDYADVKLDGIIPELRDKPLVSGAISRTSAVLVCFVTMILAFFLAALLWHGAVLTDRKLAALSLYAVAWGLGTVYNLYGKKIAGSDLFVALAMAVTFLFGALAFVQPTLLTWVVFVLTFNQTLHMNAVEGGIKDADHDPLMGVSNLARVAGVSVHGQRVTIPPSFQVFGMGIRLTSVAVVFVPFMYGVSYELWQLALLAVMLAGVLFIEVRLLRLQQFDRSLIRKLIAGASFLRYAVVPVMLMGEIGILSGVGLAVLPIAWYVAFSPLTGIRAFQPEM